MPIKLPRAPLTPDQLNLQCLVPLDGWVEVGSEQAKELDNDHQLAIKWLKMGAEAGWLFIDAHGRIFGKSPGGGENYYPYHFESYGKKYGYRMAILAAN